MKIRLMGAPDLVRAWKAAMEQSYGIVGAEYPSRYGTDVRVYFDLDDRVAEKIVARFQSAVPESSKQPKSTAVARRRKSGIEKREQEPQS